MIDDVGFEVIEELDNEEPVTQIDEFHDTVTMLSPVRPGTSHDWPPEPPMPADVELAQGTLSHGIRPRNAGFYAIVRRPTTSSETEG